MRIITSLFLGLLLMSVSFGAEKKPTTAEHLQNVSVTIRSEGAFSVGEGSGVIFTRKNKLMRAGGAAQKRNLDVCDSPSFSSNNSVKWEPMGMRNRVRYCTERC